MCVVDDKGNVVLRGNLPFCPLAVRDALEDQKVVPQRIVHESGQISIWLQRQLEDLGLPATCIDARSARKVLSAKLNKSDRSDADARQVARDIAKTCQYDISVKLRMKVEMLFAHLKRILGLGRLRLRGPCGVQDDFTLAAAAQNLRKLAKLIPNTQATA